LKREGSFDDVKQAGELYIEALRKQKEEARQNWEEQKQMTQELKNSLNNLSAELKDFADCLTGLDQEKKVKLLLEYDPGIFQELNAKLGDFYNQIANSPAQISLDINQAMQDIQSLVQKIKEAGNDPLEVTMLTTEAQSKIEDLKNRLLAIKTDAPAEVSMSVDAALQSIETLENNINALNEIQTQSQHEVQDNTNEVQGRINDLGSLNTHSMHTVQDNISQVMSQINSLNGKNTSSTHTIYIRKVEKNAFGGLVGRFAQGGEVFRRLTSRYLPGWGHKDDVPALLQRGEFVLRKEAVKRYGLSFIEALNSLRLSDVSKFAVGGLVPRLPEIKIPRFENGGIVEKPIANINLQVGNKTYQTKADLDVARALTKQLNRYQITTL
jgi:hypothetical protein